MLALGFLLTLAMDTSRYSDLQRTHGRLSISRDAIYGTSQVSKRQPKPTPWAALRRSWTGIDWGEK